MQTTAGSQTRAAGSQTMAGRVGQDAGGRQNLLKKCWCATRSIFAHKEPKADAQKITAADAAQTLGLAEKINAAPEDNANMHPPRSRLEAVECEKQAEKRIEMGDFREAVLLLTKAAYGFVQYRPYEPDRCYKMLREAAGIYERLGEWEKSATHYKAAADIAKAWAPWSGREDFE